MQSTLIPSENQLVFGKLVLVSIVTQQNKSSSHAIYPSAIKGSAVWQYACNI
jgi:hypothetical protein